MNDIVLSDVSVEFEAKRVLRSLSYTFKSGGIYCVMGDSGCGKTTLFNVMLSIVKPSSGTVTGVPKRVACVFQEDRLCEDFSAIANVRIASPDSFSKADGEALLSSLGIDSPREAVRSFSGGMKRRVALARAIAADCELILLDEAFKGLDGRTRENAVSVLLSPLTSQKTVIAVTHDEEEARLLGAKKLILSDGRIL